MIPAMLIGKIVPKIVKILLHQFKGLDKIEKILEYVENPNELDDAVAKLNERVLELEAICQNLEKKVKKG
tara:strand:- start:890 stop:1099 length:210 start_codon:yes stop_codon:yes gene_type:complete